MDTWVIVIWASLGLIAGMAVVLIFLGGAKRGERPEWVPTEMSDEMADMIKAGYQRPMPSEPDFVVEDRNPRKRPY